MGNEAPLSRGQELKPKQEHEPYRGHQSLAPYEASCGDPNHMQGWVQNGTPINVLGNKFWIFLCKN